MSVVVTLHTMSLPCACTCTAQIQVVNKNWAAGEVLLKKVLTSCPRYAWWIVPHSPCGYAVHHLTPAGVCSHIGSLVLLAQCLFHSGRVGDAATQLTVAFEALREPNAAATACGFSAADVLTWIARCLVATPGQEDAGISTLTTVIQSQQDHSGALVEYAKLCVQRNKAVRGGPRVRAGRLSVGFHHSHCHSGTCSMWLSIKQADGLRLMLQAIVKDQGNKVRVAASA